MKNIIFYTLLFIDDKNKSLSINGVDGDFAKQISIYVKCCELLQETLKFNDDRRLIVITNNKSAIEQFSKDLECLELNFQQHVPNDIGFFAAHYKLEVLQYLGTLTEDQYSFLIDNDIVCLNKMPQSLKNCIRNNIPVYYDISDQELPSYGEQAILGTKKRINPDSDSLGIWAGGEFIGGNSTFFKLLSETIGNFEPQYLKSYKELHHQGDEVLLSVAIEALLRGANHIHNAGSFQAIIRFWSVKTLNVQKKWKAYQDYYLVHLPADKTYLSKLRSIDNFSTRFESYLNRKKRYEKLKKIIRR